MTEVKIQCPCGTRYAFDVEPVNGQMPSSVQCPNCQADGTAAANEILRPKAAMSLRVSSHAAPVQPAQPAFAPPPPPPSTSFATAQAASPTPVPARGGGLLDRTSYLVKERVGLLKLADTYDILDPHSGQTIGIACEKKPVWVHLLRLVLDKRMLPTAVHLSEAEGQPPLLSIQRGFVFLRSKVRVVVRGEEIGYFKSKLLSLGGGFYVYDMRDQQVAEIKGDWKGWNFRFLDKGGREVGQVTKKWAGFGKELFTSADNYIIHITDPTAATPALLLAAGLAIDVVLKEGE
jgi:uncharacterized protein YxjI